MARALNLYLDASALVKRYVAEPGSDIVRDAMDNTEGWFICRVGFVETVRAVGLTASKAATEVIREERPPFGVIEINQRLVEHAAELAIEHELGSLDWLHLAAALVLPPEDFVSAVWDLRLHTAAGVAGIRVIPESLT